MEDAIFDEAMRHAKNPPLESISGQVREIKDSTTLPGHIISTFVGDPHAVWEHCQPSVMRFAGKNTRQPQHAAR